MKNKNIYVFALFSFLYATVFAQIPKEVPHPSNNSPIDLSQPADIILYVVLPVVVVILYFVWRNKKKKRKNR